MIPTFSVPDFTDAALAWCVLAAFMAAEGGYKHFDVMKT